MAAFHRYLVREQEQRLKAGAMRTYCALLQVSGDQRTDAELVKTIASLNVANENRLEFTLKNGSSDEEEVQADDSLTQTLSQRKKANFEKHLLRIMQAVQFQRLVPLKWSPGAGDSGNLSQSCRRSLPIPGETLEAFSQGNGLKSIDSSTAMTSDSSRSTIDFSGVAVKDLSADQVKSWMLAAKDNFRSMSAGKGGMSSIYRWESDHFVALVAVICRGAEIHMGFPPRNVQLIATLLYLDVLVDDSGGDQTSDYKSGDEDLDSLQEEFRARNHSQSQRSKSKLQALKGRLGKIETGEGKSWITALLAAFLASSGRFRVDMMTANEVLAREQWEEWEPFYSLLGLNSMSNCHKDLRDNEDKRRIAYRQSQIVYGEISSYQRDFLVSEYMDKKVRDCVSKEQYSTELVVIADEVDSLVIDNAGKSLYISHEVGDMQYLSEIFEKIWELVNEIESGTEGTKSWEDTELHKQVLQAVQAEISAGRILYPVSNPLLRDFVNENNILKWIENAFYAKDGLRADRDYLFPSTLDAGSGQTKSLEGNFKWSQLTDANPQIIEQAIAEAQERAEGEASVILTNRERAAREEMGFFGTLDSEQEPSSVSTGASEEIDLQFGKVRGDFEISNEQNKDWNSPEAFGELPEEKSTNHVLPMDRDTGVE